MVYHYKCIKIKLNIQKIGALIFSVPIRIKQGFDDIHLLNG